MVKKTKELTLINQIKKGKEVKNSENKTTSRN